MTGPMPDVKPLSLGIIVDKIAETIRLVVIFFLNLLYLNLFEKLSGLQPGTWVFRQVEVILLKSRHTYKKN